MNEINNINRRKFLEIFGACSCALMIASCSTAPITERKQLRLIPESTLNNQAAQIYEKVKQKTKLSDDKKTLSEIKEIGKRIEEAVSTYFASTNQKDPTFHFQWEVAQQATHVDVLRFLHVTTIHRLSTMTDLVTLFLV